MSAKKLGILVVFAAVVAAFHVLDLGKYLTLESLKANRAGLEALRGSHALMFSVAFVLIYIVQTAFSLPGAAVLSLAAGAVFGVVQGTLFVVSGATIGAVLAFLVSVNAGASLASIERVSQVAGSRVLGSFALLGLFALLPTIVKAVKKRRHGTVPIRQVQRPDGGAPSKDGRRPEAGGGSERINAP